MKISCIVVDDEELCIRSMEKHIAKIPFLRLAASFSDPNEAMRYLQDNPVDLIFLDVAMPNFSVDGMDFMKIMGDKQTYILTTGHPEYALESYDYNVLDFLHKPFRFERFTKAIQKAQQLIESRSEALQEVNKTPDHLFIKTKGKQQRIGFDQIYYVEAERNYLTIYRAEDAILTKSTLTAIEEQLPHPAFFRVHKSYIVALDKIDFVEKNQVGLSRNGKTQLIPISSQYKKELLQAIEATTLMKA